MAVQIKATPQEIKRFLKLDGHDDNGAHEFMGQFMERHGAQVSKYFKLVRNHVPRMDVVEPNSLLIYVDALLPRLNVVEQLVVQAVEDINAYVGLPIFDVDSPRVKDGEPINAIEVVHAIKSKTIHLGHYIPSMNVMLCADLTHSEDGEVFLVAALKGLEEKGFLKVRKTTAKKKEASIPLPRVSLGADPEFECIDRNGHVVDLHDHIPYRGISHSTSAAIGADGAGSQVELRIPPAQSPKEFVVNMRNLFNGLDRRAIFSARGDTYPLGGHIHIGFGQTVNISTKLVKLYDYFVGKHVIDMSGRARGGYKSLGTRGDSLTDAVRNQPHGIEYRTPPSAVFSHPKMTNITLKVMKTITERFLHQQEFALANDRASAEELMRYAGLSEKQARYFLNFTEAFRHEQPYSFNVCAAWHNNFAHVGSRRRRKRKVDARRIGTGQYTINLNFADDWTDGVRRLVHSALNSVHVLNSNAQMHMYGLSGQRGNVVAGLPSIPDVADVTEHPHPERFRDWRSGGVFAIGLPLAFRMGEYSRDAANAVVNALLTAAQEYAKWFDETILENEINMEQE